MSVSRVLGTAALLAATSAGARAADLAPAPRPDPAPALVRAVDTLSRGDVVEALARALSDGEAGVRRSAVNSLRDIGSPGALSAVEAALDDRDADVRAAAQAVLGLRPPRPNKVFPAAARSAPLAAATLDALHARLRSPAAEGRMAAARALGNHGDARSTGALADALRDPEGVVRQAAAAALGNIGDRRAGPALAAAWPDQDEHVRGAIVSALGAVGHAAGASVVVEALGDPDADVRRVAAETLGNLGSALAPTARNERAAGPPAATASDPCPAIPAAPGLDLAGAVTALLGSPDAGLRERAALALAVLSPAPGAPRDGDPLAPPAGDKDHHHALAAALSDPVTAVRIAAACSLARVGDERALELLGQRARPGEPEALRLAARRAMERITARVEGGRR